MQKRDLYYERIPTKLLREDVRYLGNILGKVIKAQEGQKFFELVEKVRKLSKANKTSLKINQTNRKVIRAIKNLSPKNTFKLTRAFTHFMNFINLAELIDVQKAILSNSNVFGKDINVEEAGPKLASDINAMLTNIATDLNIPMSQEMAVAVINELNNMASERGDDGFALLENGKITRAILNDAFGRAHVRNPFAGQKSIKA